MSKVLLTGGAGFIGAHVAKKLLEAGNEVVIVDDFNDYYAINLKEERLNALLKGYDFALYRGDIRDFVFLERIFREGKIEKVCHLAARAGVRASIKDPLLYEEVNIRGTINLLELAHKFSVSLFLAASSSSVYGNDCKAPFKEKADLSKPISPYAASKRGMELYAYTYHYLYKIPMVLLRYFSVYGPWGRPDMAYFIFLDAWRNHAPIKLYNFGKMKRDFTYIDDIVEGTVKALSLTKEFEIINLGNNTPISLGTMVSRIEEKLGAPLIKELKEAQAGDVLETCADISKAKRLLGYDPKTPFEVGMQKFIEWYREYYRV